MKSLRLGLQLSKEQPSFNYKPLINYRFNNILYSDRSVVDGGVLPRYNATLQFGRGISFNGEDQRIVLPVSSSGDRKKDSTFLVSNNHTVTCSTLQNIWVTPEAVWYYYYAEKKARYDKVKIGSNTSVAIVTKNNKTIEIYKDGQLFYSKTHEYGLHLSVNPTIGSRGGSAYHSGRLSEYITITKAITPAEIDYFHKHPERFLYTEVTTEGDGNKTYKLGSKILSQDTLDNVYNFLPLCELDEYVRDMAGYSEDIAVQETFDNNIDVWEDYSDASDSTFQDGRLRLTRVDDDDKSIYSIKNFNVEEGCYYKITATAYGNEAYSSGVRIYSDNATFLNRTFRKANDKGQTESVVVKAIDSGLWLYLLGDSNLPVDEYMEYDNIIIEKISSAYEIENFTNSVRDEADHSSTGLQTCFWKRDLLGVPQYAKFDRIFEDNQPLFSSDITDTELYNLGSWELEIVMKKAALPKYNTTGYLLSSYHNNKGMMFIIDKSWDPNASAFYFYGDRDDRKAVASPTVHLNDSITHHVVVRVENNKDVTIFIDGKRTVSGDITDWVPSDIPIFRNSMPTPLIELRMLKIHQTLLEPTDLYSEAKRKGFLND